MPKYSFIIPVYNAEKVIGRLVDQIINQPYKNFELILVNDGSKDTSLEIINNLAEEDDRIIAIDQSNGGPSSARNKGLKKAKGKFIIFCDSDDEINSLELGKTLFKLEDSTKDMVVLGWKIVQKNSTGDAIVNRELIIPKQTIKNTQNIKQKTIKSIGEDGRMYNLWNKIYKADVIKNKKLHLRDDLRFGEDLLFNFKFLEHCEDIYSYPGSGFYIYEEDSPTSIVNNSKLNYFYRQENLRGLTDFATSLDDDYSKDLVNFVKWRWLVSYTLSLCGSNKPKSEQIKLTTQAVRNQKLKPANKSSQLSKKQYLMEIILYTLSATPLALWSAMKILNTAKKRRRSQDITVKLPEI